MAVARGAHRGLWALSALGWACSPNASGAGGSGVGQLDSGHGTTEGDATGPGAGSGVADEAGTGNVTGSVTVAETDPEATATPGSSDDGMAEGTTSSGSGDASMTGDENPAPQQEQLQRAGFGACNLPLWCYEDSIDMPVGQQMWMQECFDATIEPPFELQRLEFMVAGLGGTLGDVRVRVYANTGAAGPGALLAEQAIAPAAITLGSNVVELNPPLVLGQQSICIGLASPNPAGALGIAVNESSTASDVSFFRLDAGPGCAYPTWTDVVDTIASPSGNWCIRGTIEEQ